MQIRDIDIRIKSGEHVFFTSDTHFGHTKMIEYAHRPFTSNEDMTERLIENWNNKVGKDDIVFHLGDFALGKEDVWCNVLPRLNGTIYLVVGNHDRQNWKPIYEQYFKYCSYEMFIKVEDYKILLTHCPYLCFPHSDKGEYSYWNLHGHVHTGPLSESSDEVRMPLRFPTQYDVGVDNNNFAPISFEEVKQIILKQQEKSLKK